MAGFSEWSQMVARRALAVCCPRNSRRQIARGRYRKNGPEWHPLAFCSKRTSPSEEKYEPFMLEFTTLKFALDDFDTIIYGSPIEIETDCQALWDVLLNKKQSATHARWEESIICRNIVDIRHHPGVTNVVADAISRKWAEAKGPSKDSDGADWSVRPDWEASSSISNNIMQVTTAGHADESASLHEQFADDPWLSDVVNALTNRDMPDIRTCHRARHRALNFAIENGKLWCIRMKAKDWVASVECVSQMKGFNLAMKMHEENGHFGWDHMQLKLHNKWFWPGMDRDSKEAIAECTRCKNFGPQFINSLLQLIKHCKPFDLLCADYLSLPKGKGGFKTVLLITDTFSNFIWAYTLKSTGTGKTTLAGLHDLCLRFCRPEGFMTDGGSHFDNEDMNTFCSTHGIEHITTPAYAPWTNGLIENMNKILLGRLKRMCAPDTEDMEANDTNMETTPAHWTNHVEEAICSMNTESCWHWGSHQGSYYG